MSEQPASIYLNLIQQLLECPNGEEGNILEANQNLLDETLIQIMLGVAQNAREENEENIADFLESLAREIVQWLTPVKPEDYFTFLQEVLQAEYESDSDPEVVYPLLKLNLEKLNPYFAQLLQEWARNVFSQSSPEDANTIAGIIFGFCNSLCQFPLGSRLDNLEIAITGYETVLEVYTREAFPVDWAMTQNNLGNAYSNRIKGERAENLEGAIAAYRLSLEVRTREAFPVDWATTQNNLGAAYGDRIKGERAENLEGAIAAYQLSLEVLTREAFPVDWATTQNNLGTAYSNRIKGERAENLEMAIAAYQRSLEVLTREAFPVDWATTQNNLGAAYHDRIKGEKAENLEGAITAFQLSLEVRTREAFPVDWAMIQNNLGIAYSDRIKGERAENLEGAIAAFQLSLEVRTREAFPVDWAMTKNNLGNAYSDRIKGERAENLEGAIAAYRLNLEVYTHEAFPVDWAKVQLNYGEALHECFLELGNSRDLDQAIEAYQKALTVYRPSYDYEKFGKTMGGLGKALFQRGSYSEAISILEQARELWQSEKELPELAVTLYELAKIYHRTGCLERARLYFKDSLRLFRRLDRPDKSATVLTALANLELQGGKIEIAIRHLRSAQEYYQGENNLEKLKEVNNLLSLVPQHFIRKIEARDVNPQPV